MVTRDRGKKAHRGAQGEYCTRQFSTMAKAIGRFIRSIHSIFVPTTAIIGFSCLLTFFFVLYQPTRGPGDVQRLGWQSWDTISPLPTADLPSGVNEAGNQPPPTSGDHDTDADWWNVTVPGSTTAADSSSLPLDVWAPLLPHDTGCMASFVFFRFYSIPRTELAFYHSIRDRSRPMHV
jgi:hypothetical protein